MINCNDIIPKKAEQFAKNRTEFLQGLALNKPNYDILVKLFQDAKGKLRRKLKEEYFKKETVLQTWNLIELLSIDPQEQQDILKTLAVHI